LSLATVFILMMTIFLVTSLFLFKHSSDQVVTQLQEKVDISVYFKEGSAEADILGVREEITKMPEVKDVKYVSQDEALKDFMEKHKDNPVLIQSLQEIGTNPLLASLNIRAVGATQYAAVANYLETAPFKDLFEKVDYYQRKSVIERIFSISSAINRTGLFVSLLLALVSFLVAFNQVRMAIYNAREEISIQRLVGASNWFIRGPFLIQGIISGIIATVITCLLFVPILLLLNPKIEALFPSLGVLQFFFNNFFIILLIQLATGLFLGVASSLIAMRKYLEV